MRTTARKSAAIAPLVALAVLAVCADAYLPGVAPHDYSDGELVELKVNKLTSVRTQLPYDYYDALPFCKPVNITDKKENLGEILSGDRISNSLYTISFLRPMTCEILGANGDAVRPWTKEDKKPYSCTHTYTAKEMARFVSFVKNEYRVHWTLDNMPAARPRGISATTKQQEYEIGFPLGSRDADGGVYLNNHVSITVKYHKDAAGVQRVVGFEVEPLSIDDLGSGTTPTTPTCKAGLPLKIAERGRAPGEKRVRWTYSVKWVEEPTVTWSHRWDRYFANSDSQIHWFSIVNSVMIVLFLTGMVAMIMMRTLHADLRQYSQNIEAREDVEETGWKLVHGDVFRPPRNPSLLSVLVGFGAQTFACVVITLIFAVLGLLSPANSGGLITAMVVLILLSSVFAGYFSTRLYKMFKGPNWKRNVILTAFLVPGVIFGTFLFINFFIWGVKSSGGVSFTALLTIMGMWFGISLPLAFLGSYIAFKKPAIEHPVGTNQIPRQIPDQVWYMSPALSVLMGGILPFGAVFIELFFILSAVWGQQLFYIFGFLFIVFVILVVTCAEISVVMVYFQLCSEDYHWWWRSFLTSGSSALYFFLYSIFYFATKLSITNFISGLLYFGYTFIFTIVFFVLTGCIGFFACFLFVRKLFSSIPFE